MRTSLPTPPDQVTTSLVSLSQFESTLEIFITSHTKFPELQRASETSKETSVASFLQPEEDTTSLLCDTPSLPGGVTQVRFLEDYSEGEKSGEGSSHPGYPPHYGSIPPTCSEVGSERGEETDVDSCSTSIPGPSRMTTQPRGEPLRELSGRSRAILKLYFNDADPCTFPVGHAKVASPIPQVYHLLRVLTDEAISMSCSAMEKMVIGAVKGTPATGPSGTEQIWTRTRAQIPRHHRIDDSCSGVFTTDAESGPETVGDNSLPQEIENFFCQMAATAQAKWP